MDIQLTKQLKDLEFVESVSTDVDTQTALLESLTDDNTDGRFQTADDMFRHMTTEWSKEDQNEKR